MTPGAVRTGPGWYLQPSPGGDWLVAGRAGVAALLDTGTGEWANLPPGTRGAIVPGAGDDTLD